MTPLVARLSISLVLAGALTAQTDIPEKILKAPFTPDAKGIGEHVRLFADASMQGRMSGSKGAQLAASKIAAEFEELGLKPAGDENGFEQRFHRMVAVSTGEKDDDGRTVMKVQKLTCRNVLAWLPGSDEDLQEEYFLVGAHFDHLGTAGEKVYHGADDNASGVAGMLAIACACAKGEIPLRRSVLFVAFGAEEQGLQGSRYFAQHPPRSLQELVTMINLDMIGRPRLLDKKQFKWAKPLVGIPDSPAAGVLGTDSSPELNAIARAVFEAEKLPLFAPEDFGMLKDAIKKMAEGRSDHAPFEQRSIPFLFFSTSEHDDYHQPTDTVDKVDPETIRRIAGCVYRIILAADARDERPTWQRAASAEAAGDKER